MKFVIQRVTNAKCEVDNQITGQIEQGFCVFIGVAEGDNEQIADKMIRKLLGMRIFADADGKTNLALQDVNGGLLLISQFFRDMQGDYFQLQSFSDIQEQFYPVC